MEMLKMKKVLLISISTLIAISIVVYIFRGIPLKNDFFQKDTLWIMYANYSIEDGKPVRNTKEYTLNSDSAEYKKIEQVFQKYRYHNCFRTWIGDSSLRDISYTFNLSCGDKNIILADIPNIMIGSKVYRIGYIGTSKIKALNRELKDILDIE